LETHPIFEDPNYKPVAHLESVNPCKQLQLKPRNGCVIEKQVPPLKHQPPGQDAVVVAIVIAGIDDVVFVFAAVVVIAGDVVVVAAGVV